MPTRPQIANYLQGLLLDIGNFVLEVLCISGWIIGIVSSLCLGLFIWLCWRLREEWKKNGY